MSKRLAIIGGGSSGLITLKTALDMLPDWDIVCFEKSNSIIGCWGNPYPGFASTSTKYTTQFACFPEFDASVQAAGRPDKTEFFCEGEYGEYLERFADRFQLRPHIHLKQEVTLIQRDKTTSTWTLTVHNLNDSAPPTQRHVDHIVLCTGLAAQPKPLNCDLPVLNVSELNSLHGLSHISEKQIVVVGGGESAVDYANRLANPKLKNDVYLSLHSGIRVSPRYHPIRGVPSDFLRNRLMLSIHPDIRNWIGQRFVEARIKYQTIFERLFPDKNQNKGSSSPSIESEQTKQDWAYRLTKTAKDDLFNMFHNKSDDFLDAVGEGRIKIIGPPIDAKFREFYEYDSPETLMLSPQHVVPAVGYQANFKRLTSEEIQLTDFYRGCTHITFRHLHLIGFARPIIGNIPSISEMQARYVCSLIAGEITLPDDVKTQHAKDCAFRQKRYEKLNLNAVYPVEMFPYCDDLARLLSAFPSRETSTSLWQWIHQQLSPATTLHYKKLFNQHTSSPAKIYMPPLLILLLLCLKPIDLLYQWRSKFAE